ncbi:MAG: lipopolysaccharide assembly protein LapA domain-containing protein [Pseudonocardia sp.]|nr:lipopolysaccharide assembly protein LapA domain-containing protein [Pseudonocardia sp.]
MSDDRVSANDTGAAPPPTPSSTAPGPGPTVDEPGPTGSAHPGAAEPGGGTVAIPEGTGPTAPTAPPARHARQVNRTRISGVWVGLILSTLVLIFLLIFILQNLNPVEIAFLGALGTLPTGVAMLFAAVAGILLVAIPGSARILQLRRAARKGARRAR